VHLTVAADREQIGASLDRNSTTDPRRPPANEIRSMNPLAFSPRCAVRDATRDEQRANLVA
jgi:hypothetical protein